MSVIDLHPEELLEREAQGRLSASERDRLGAHLARCATCRFERQLRADFATDLEGDLPELDIAALLSAGQVASQVARPAAPEAPAAPGPALADRISLEASSSDMRAPKPVVTRRRRRTATWLLVAAALCAVSVAGANGVGVRAWSRLVDGASDEVTVPSSVHAAAPPAKAKAAAVRHRPDAPSAAPDPVAEVAPTLAEISPVDTLTAPVASVVPSAPVAASAVRQRVAALSAPPLRVAAADVARDGADPASLFDAANDARRHGDYGRALAIHRELQSRFGQSQEARVARATVGRLLRDRGDSAGALASFDAYLGDAPGALTEEAMVGRATALERLGRASDARRAWEGLLAAFPVTSYAEHARARLAGSSAR